MATTPVVAGQKLVAGSETSVPDGKGREKTVKIAARFEPYDLTGNTDRSKEILNLIAAGSILVNENTIVRIEETYLVYTKLLATDQASMEALTDGPVSLVMEDGKPVKGKDSVAQKFNYGNDLDAKSWVANQWRKSDADPKKAVERTLKEAGKIPG